MLTFRRIFQYLAKKKKSQSETTVQWDEFTQNAAQEFRNAQRDSRLAVEPLLDEDLYLVGQSSLIGRSSSPIAFSSIPQRSVLGLTPLPASRAIIQTQILRNQIIPSETLEVDSLSALRMALEAGLGCAILSRATVLADLAAERYHARRIVDPPMTRSLGLISLAERPQTKAFVEVRKTVVEVVRAAINEKRWPAKGDGRGRTAN